MMLRFGQLCGAISTVLKPNIWLRRVVYDLFWASRPLLTISLLCLKRDKNDISPPKTPDYLPNDENYDHDRNECFEWREWWSKPIKTLYEPTETFQFTHFASCDPPGVKCGFIKGEAIRLLRTNSSRKNLKRTFWNSNNTWKQEGTQKTL